MNDDSFSLAFVARCHCNTGLAGYEWIDYDRTAGIIKH